MRMWLTSFRPTSPGKFAISNHFIPLWKMDIVIYAATNATDTARIALDIVGCENIVSTTTICIDSRRIERPRPAGEACFRAVGCCRSAPIIRTSSMILDRSNRYRDIPVYNTCTLL